MPDPLFPLTLPFLVARDWDKKTPQAKTQGKDSKRDGKKAAKW